jgi:hypothetical protein
MKQCRRWERRTKETKDGKKKGRQINKVRKNDGREPKNT